MCFLASPMPRRRTTFKWCNIYPAAVERNKRRIRGEDFNKAVPQRLAGAGEKAKVGTTSRQEAHAGTYINRPN